jgi:hypothetical protein
MLQSRTRGTQRFFVHHLLSQNETTQIIIIISTANLHTNHNPTSTILSYTYNRMDSRIPTGLYILFCLFFGTSITAGLKPRSAIVHHRRFSPYPANIPLISSLRGGSDSEYDDVGENDDEMSIESPDTWSSSSSSKGSIVGTLTTTLFRTVKGMLRATFAVWDVSDMADDASVPQHVVGAIKRMWTAFFSSFRSSSEGDSSPPSEEDNEMSNDESSSASPNHRQMQKFSTMDFGPGLGSSYGVECGRDVLDELEPILTGSFQDALREARSQGRLLVVFIPGHVPRKRDTADVAAVESLLSEEVAMICRKKAKKSATTGSFVIWSAKASSPEAALAIKRLKVQTKNAKGMKRPILAVVYPNRAVDSHGRPKIAPRLLAQHHCSPPPKQEIMAAWLNALRKRHAKQYTSMHTELKELEYFRERKEGYKESVKSDLESKKREEQEAAERKAKEEAKKKRAEEIRQRRISLAERLPEEPEKSDKTAWTIALRLADGRSLQRRFPEETSLETIFAWVDVSVEMEQETVTLTTMNGKLSFNWNDRDTTLQESGISKMTGFRVSIKEVEPDELVQE